MSLKKKLIKRTGIQRWNISILTMKDFGKAMKHLKVFGKNALDEKKKLFKELSLIAVAFAHAQKDELSIGIGMLGRALEKLGTFSFYLSFN